MIQLSTIDEKYLLRIIAAREYFNRFFVKYPGQYWIAGGALLSFFHHGYVCQNGSDVDIYAKDKLTLDILTTDLLKDGNYVETTKDGSGGKASLVVKLKLMANYSDWSNIDLINIPFNSMQECCDDFDFTICKAAISSTDMYFHSNYFEHLTKMKLVHCRNFYSKNTLSRIIKYTERGFNLDKSHGEEIFEDILKAEAVNNKGFLRYFTINKISSKKVTITEKGFENKTSDDIPFLGTALLEISKDFADVVV